MTPFEILLERYEITITAAITLVLIAQWYLGPEAEFVETYRSALLRRIAPVGKMIGRPTVRVKGDADYICSVDMGPEEFERVIYPTYRRNLLATKKAVRGGRDNLIWSEGSWAAKAMPTAQNQHHLFFFKRENRLDVYGHYETAPVDPQGHVSDGQTHGDPNNTLRDLLDEQEIEYYQR